MIYILQQLLQLPNLCDEKKDQQNYFFIVKGIMYS